MNPRTLLKQIVPLAVVCSVLLGYQYLGATWSEPTASAPNNNTETPLNVGSDEQIKNGGLGVDALAVFGDVAVDGDFTASTSVASNLFCNADRSTCATIDELLAGGDAAPAEDEIVYGVHTQAECTAAGGVIYDTGGGINVCRFTRSSCPSGWTQHQSWATYVSTTCGGGCDGRCTTSGRSWGNNSAPMCIYSTGRDTSDGCDTTGSATCSAARSQVGCY